MIPAERAGVAVVERKETGNGNAAATVGAGVMAALEVAVAEAGRQG